MERVRRRYGLPPDVHSIPPPSSTLLPIPPFECAAAVVSSSVRISFVVFCLPPKLLNKVTYKAPKQFSSAAGNAPLSRKNLESLRSRAGRDAASCDPSVRFNEVRLLNFLRCYSRVVVDVEREKGEARPTRDFYVFNGNEILIRSCL